MDDMTPSPSAQLIIDLHRTAKLLELERVEKQLEIEQKWREAIKVYHDALQKVEAIRLERNAQEWLVAESVALVKYFEEQKEKRAVAELIRTEKGGAVTQDGDKTKGLMENKGDLSDAFVIYLVGPPSTGKTTFEHCFRTMYRSFKQSHGDSKLYPEHLYRCFENGFGQDFAFTLCFFTDDTTMLTEDSFQERTNWSDGLVVVTCQEIDESKVRDLSPHYVIVKIEETFKRENNAVRTKLDWSVAQAAKLFSGLVKNDPPSSHHLPARVKLMSKLPDLTREIVEKLHNL